MMAANSGLFCCCCSTVSASLIVIMMMIMEVARYFDGSGKNPTQFSPFDLKQSLPLPRWWWPLHLTAILGAAWTTIILSWACHCLAGWGFLWVVAIKAYNFHSIIQTPYCRRKIRLCVLAQNAVGSKRKWRGFFWEILSMILDSDYFMLMSVMLREYPIKILSQRHERHDHEWWQIEPTDKLFFDFGPFCT